LNQINSNSPFSNIVPKTTFLNSLFKKLANKYLWIAVLIYASLIFVGSSIPGTDIDTGPPGFDKILHLFEYFILSTLLYFALVSNSEILDLKNVNLKSADYKKIFYITFILSSLYGVSDEIHQLFVPNRYFELLDIFTDSVGSLLGSFLAFKISTRKLSSFNVDYKEAVLLQERLRDDLIIEGESGDIHIVAGVDVSFEKGGDRIFAAVVVMDINTFEVVDYAHHSMITSFPYIPGLLSFREGPAIIEAFKKLKTTPQAIIFDGQGIAHQRRFGLASHLGLILSIPSVGCAKTRLVGEFGDLLQEKGSTTPLTLNSGPSGVPSDEPSGEPSDELIGYVVRTKKRVKPLFVSPGNMISHKGAVDIVLSSTGKYRLPEPIRAAHNLANKLRVEYKG